MSFSCRKFIQMTNILIFTVGLNVQQAQAAAPICASVHRPSSSGDVILASINSKSIAKPWALEPRLYSLKDIPISKDKVAYFNERLSATERSSIFLNLIDNPDMLLGHLGQYLSLLQGLIIPRSEAEQDTQFSREKKIQGFYFGMKFRDISVIGFSDKDRRSMLKPDLEMNWHKDFADLALQVMDLSSKPMKAKKIRAVMRIPKPGGSASPRDTVERLIEFAREKNLYEKEYEAAWPGLNEHILPDLRNLDWFFNWLRERPERREYAQFLLMISAEVIIKKIMPPFGYKTQSKVNRNYGNRMNSALDPDQFGSVQNKNKLGLLDRMKSVARLGSTSSLALRNTKLDIAAAAGVFSPQKGQAAGEAVHYLAMGDKLSGDHAVLLDKLKSETFYQDEFDYYGSVSDVENLALGVLGSLSDLGSRIQVYQSQVRWHLEQIQQFSSHDNPHGLPDIQKKLQQIQIELAVMENDQRDAKTLLKLVGERIQAVLGLMPEYKEKNTDSGIDMDAEIQGLQNFLKTYENSKDEKVKLIDEALTSFRRQLQETRTALSKNI